MTQTDILIEFTNLQNQFLDFIAIILTFLGNEEFYFLVIPFIYWCISKKIGFRLFYIFMLSVYVNSWLKVQFAVERPIGTEGVHSLFLSSAEVGSHYPYDSFPSGHAQGSTTLWGYLAAVIRTRTFTVFAIILILLISVSRLYAGLHWPTDIVIGILIGICFVWIGVILQDKISRLPQKYKWVLILTVPLLLIGLFPEEEGMKYAGILLGASVGYFSENRFVRMKIDKKKWRKLSAFIFGIAVTFALQEGLKVIFPEGNFFDFFRYLIIGLWITLVAPYFILKFGFYRSSND